MKPDSTRVRRTLSGFEPGLPARTVFSDGPVACGPAGRPRRALGQVHVDPWAAAYVPEYDFTPALDGPCP